MRVIDSARGVAGSVVDAMPEPLRRRLPDPAVLPREARELLEDPVFGAGLAEVAAREERSPHEVREEAAAYLREMAADHGEGATRGWARLGEWFLRAHDVLVDEEQLRELRRLDRDHTLAIAFSHRSYLDGWVIPNELAARRFSPTFTFGGANLDLPVIGSLASHTGIIFIRRATAGLPVYRYTLRAYIRQLVRNRRNMAWSIEGGRTRTGKLRPPVHGILKYLIDSLEGDGHGPEVPDIKVVPMSVTYEQLHEVALMTSEARGARKNPEDLRWVVRFARLQRDRLGRAYLTVGEPFSLRDRVRELVADGVPAERAVERVALDISHRLNRATPVTVTAIVCLALLGADRALTLDEVLATVQPLAAYVEARHWPVAGAANLEDRSTVHRTLQELTASGVLTGYDGGTEPVWRIGEDQHLVAAFYRNTVIHILVERAIGELALLTAGEADPDTLPEGGALRAAWEEAKRVRDLLKFEFFFPGRAEFEHELRAELAILTGDDVTELPPEKAREVLAGARPHLAHLVLRPFLDAYLVVADRLADLGDAGADTEQLLADTLALGRQWELQRRVSGESVSLELYRTAVALAGHRQLLEPGDDLAARRAAFADEIRDLTRRIAVVADLAAAAGQPGDSALGVR